MRIGSARAPERRVDSLMGVHVCARGFSGRPRCGRSIRATNGVRVFLIDKVRALRGENTALPHTRVAMIR